MRGPQVGLARFLRGGRQSPFQPEPVKHRRRPLARGTADVGIGDIGTVNPCAWRCGKDRLIHREIRPAPRSPPDRRIDGSGIGQVGGQTLYLLGQKHLEHQSSGFYRRHSAGLIGMVGGVVMQFAQQDDVGGRQMIKLCRRNLSRRNLTRDKRQQKRCADHTRK